MEEIMLDIGMVTENKEKIKLKVESDGTGDKKILNESSNFNFNFTKDMIDKLYDIIQMPNGKDMMKILLISQNN